MSSKNRYHPRCDIGAQCGAQGGNSTQANILASAIESAVKSVKLASVKNEKPVSILKSPAKPKPKKQVSFQGGSYTKIYYSFEPTVFFNTPYQRPANFRFSARNRFPEFVSIHEKESDLPTVPYTEAYGVRKPVQEFNTPVLPGRGRADILRARVAHFNSEPMWAGKAIGPIPRGPNPRFEEL